MHKVRPKILITLACITCKAEQNTQSHRQSLKDSAPVNQEHPLVYSQKSPPGRMTCPSTTGQRAGWYHAYSGLLWSPLKLGRPGSWVLRHAHPMPQEAGHVFQWAVPGQSRASGPSGGWHLSATWRAPAPRPDLAAFLSPRQTGTLRVAGAWG